MWVKLKFFVLIASLWQQSCQSADQPTADEGTNPPVISEPLPVQTGAEQTDLYQPQLEGKRLGLVVNHTSMIGNTHLVDNLLSGGFAVRKIFAPEHGFRGTADAGEQVTDGKDVRTGLPIISLYGSHKEPTAEDLAGLDLVIFDIQDVGARFYTYISTLHYVMQACGKQGIPVLILDRPNPNGHYVDGPILDPAFQSFIGMHPVPVVHGMTVGEYGRMIKGEGWLEAGSNVELTVIPCANYSHQTPYDLPHRPSPNLPNMRSIYLYPSLCFLEGSVFNVGRGTNEQFQVFGHPEYTGGSYQYTPVSMPGAKYPKLENQLCKGENLTQLEPGVIRREARLNLSYLLKAYRHFPEPDRFFRADGFFNLLAGSSRLREQIEAGWSEEQIRASWADDLAAFNQIRNRYLLYDR